MKVTWGAVTTLYNGNADDTDPTNPPCSYSGPAPGKCTDGPSSASSAPQNGIATAASSATSTLSASAIAWIGAKPAGLPSAQSFNKIDQAFTVAKSWYDPLLNFFGLGAKFSIKIELSAAHDFRVGTGDVRGIARILGAGLTPGIEHHYEIQMNPADATKIDVKRDAAPWKTVPTPGSVADTDAVAGIKLPAGNYVFRSELNLMDSADGHVSLNVLMTAQMSF